MNPRISLLASLLLGGWFHTLAGGASASPVPLPTGAYRVQKAEIIDPNGFERPMTAMTLVVPAGWRTSGGVVWQQGQVECGPLNTHVQWRAESPDGVSAIEILPEEMWSGTSIQIPGYQPKCPNISINNVRDYLTWLAQRVRSGARVLDFRDRPEFAAPLAFFNRNDSMSGYETRSWVQGGELLLGYQLNGREMRETIAGTVLFSHTRMAGVMPGEIREFMSLTALPAYAVRAPEGQLDFQLAELVRRSIKRDPQWGARMDEHFRRINEANRKGAADRHQIRMDTAREIAEMNQQTYANTQASQDRSAERFSQTIREVETYVDPSSQTHVELPNNYDHVWRLNDDTYILTNDANFQPGRDLGVDGRQLEVAR